MHSNRRRIAILSQRFSKLTGYLENGLPPALARLGCDVHLITTSLPPYDDLPEYRETFGNFFEAERLPAGSVESYNGFTIHVLPHRMVLGYVRLQGLWRKLRELRPDIVQCSVALGWLPLDAALAQPFLRYTLFTGNHSGLSTFAMNGHDHAWWKPDKIRCFLTRSVPGRLASLVTARCYAVTCDAAEIAWRYFGVQRSKVEVMHLGVDTTRFFPVKSQASLDERERVRRDLGFSDRDVVCIHTGRLTEAKNPYVLAQAVERLRANGEPYAALFVGEGAQRQAIARIPHCVALPFQPHDALAGYYRCADIAVWPTTESISMLDAAACGLPLIVSDGTVYRDHVEGNGLVYVMNDIDDLVRGLLALRDGATRRALGSHGAAKMARAWGWDGVARQRLKEYDAAIENCLHA